MRINISLLFAYKNSNKIYNILEPLPPKVMRSLILNYSTCDELKMYKDIEIRWCCLDKCYQVSYNTSETFNPISVEYNMKACESLPLIRKMFCYSDVAEITNNISICYLIDDNDISSLCFARLTLNKTMCNNIRDAELRKACIQSVEAKILWKETKK